MEEDFKEEGFKRRNVSVNKTNTEQKGFILYSRYSNLWKTDKTSDDKWVVDLITDRLLFTSYS